MSKPLHIALLLQGGREWLGGFDYVKNLALALGSLPAAGFKVSLITREPLPAPDRAQIVPAAARLLCLETDAAPRTVANRLTWKVRQKLLGASDPRLTDLLCRYEVDFAYPYVSTHGHERGFTYAGWIPDFQHKHLPEFFSPAEVLYRDNLFKRIAKTSPVIVLSSRTAERDFQKFFPFAAGKTRVLSFRTPCSESWFRDDPIELQQAYHLPEKFYLVANQFWKHKNHLLVLKALKRLTENGLHPHVVFTGNIHDYRFPEYSDKLLQTIHQLGIHQQVHVLGLVPRAHYIQLLRRCAAVVQPSLFEGWSTIVEDARSLGKALILSDIEVHREQDPPKAVFFARDSEEDLAFHLGDQWNHLSAGPDLDTEACVRKKNTENLRQVGERLLQIANDAGNGNGAG